MPANPTAAADAAHPPVAAVAAKLAAAFATPVDSGYRARPGARLSDPVSIDPPPPVGFSMLSAMPPLSGPRPEPRGRLSDPVEIDPPPPRASRLASVPALIGAAGVTGRGRGGSEPPAPAAASSSVIRPLAAASAGAGGGRLVEPLPPLRGSGGGRLVEPMPALTGAAAHGAETALLLRRLLATLTAEKPKDAKGLRGGRTYSPFAKE
jgi:hypothetical protein